MYTIKNENGSTYYIVREYHNRENEPDDNVLLLASYGGKSEDDIYAGADPTQYIVARFWSEKYKCWASGKYFPCFPGKHTEAKKAAISEFIDSINY